MIKFFKKPKNEPKPIEWGVNYFVSGDSVVFDLNGLDFTFEKFYVEMNEDSMKILVEDEAPMNLIYLLDTLEVDMDVERKDILEADSVRFKLKLKDEIFLTFKPKMLKVTDIKEIFQLKANGATPLKDFKNYELELYGTKKVIEEVIDNGD